MARILTVLLAIVALPGAQAATQTFFPDDSGALQLQASATQYATPLGHTIAYLPGATGPNTAYWETTLTQDADIVPISVNVWVEVTELTVSPPVAVPGYEYCPVEVSIGVTGAFYYYYCIASMTTDTLAPGIYQLQLEFAEGLDPIEAKAGDVLWIDVWNMGSSSDAAPTMFVIPGDATAPTSFVVDGTSEPMPLVLGNTTQPPDGNTTEDPSSSSAPPSSSTNRPPSSSPTGVKSSSSKPPSSSPATDAPAKTSPMPGLLGGTLVLAALATVMRLRRRLDE